MASSRAPYTRWDIELFQKEQKAATYGGFLVSGVFMFDSAFFSISKTEAQALDPHSTLILESNYSALHNSAPVTNLRTALSHANIGIFLGAGGSLASAIAASCPASSRAVTVPSVYSGTSGSLSVASGRVSYALGLVGPCLTLDTACSSSLVALHLAISALRLGECPRSGTSGVGVMTALVSFAFSVAGMLSSFGRCHTFDRCADGYCRGEGCGAFLSCWGLDE